jgi:hypothetical protein
VNLLVNNIVLSQMKNLNTQKKIKTPLCAAVDTGSHGLGLDSCPLYGRFSNVGPVTSAQHAKVATRVEVCMKDRHCFDICFLVSEGNKSICCMKCHYGNAGTVIPMLFWDRQVPLVQNYMCKRDTVRSALVVTSLEII